MSNPPNVLDIPNALYVPDVYQIYLKRTEYTECSECTKYIECIEHTEYILNAPNVYQPYKKLGYVFYTFCIRFVYVFKKSTVFIRNWSIFRINYTFLIIHFLYVFKNLIKNVELKTYNLYGILINSL